MRSIILISLTTLIVSGLLYGQTNSSTSITSVVNASGYQTELAPDTVFVIFGSGLGPSSIVTASAPSYPTSLSGTSITFTPASGGTPVTAKMVYSLATQVAGLLPSSITPGTYSVTVTYNNQTSAAFGVNVLARSLGIATANSSGSGNAQATIANVNGGISLTRFTTGSLSYGGRTWVLSPAHPGDTIVLWGTGGGADPANDTGGTSGDQTAAGNFVVNVGGRQITPLYAGASSGYPGLWQVNFTLPTDIATDCFVYVQVSAGGVLSNGVNLPIAAPGQNACSDPNVTTSLLSKLDAGQPVTISLFTLNKITYKDTGITQQTSGGAVLSFTAAAWSAPMDGPHFGDCEIYVRGVPDPVTPQAYLDAGSVVSLSGPNLPAGYGLARTAGPLGPFYTNTPPSGGFQGGAYNLSATGGAQVGAFSASTIFPSSFTATNFDSITGVDRTQPFTVNWTGSGVDTVLVQLNGTVGTGSSQQITSIICDVPGSLGTYSVPVGALAYLKSTTATFQVLANSKPGTFTPNLTAGGQVDLGQFKAVLGVSKTLPVQ